jgi:homotetrameric cytidine deaminase/rRNA maturation RNase YbeY
MISEVVIQNIQDKIDITGDMEDIILNAVELCLTNEKIERAVEVSILLVDDEKIKEINNEQRGIDSPTDVLSFPIVEMVDGKIKSNLGDMNMEENTMLLGDIVISLERAYKQAKEYAHSFYRELAFLTTHGVFHLLGYDHENEKNERIVLKKQEDVLKIMGLKRQKYEQGEILDCEVLAKEALNAKLNAYAPYSNFNVGAALLTESGKIYTGANVENISFSATICAERTAIFKAVSEGERKIKAIAISSDSPEIIFPCGTCLQVIYEFGDENTMIVCSNNKGDYKVFNLSVLLPYPFSKVKSTNILDNDTNLIL